MPIASPIQTEGEKGILEQSILFVKIQTCWCRIKKKETLTLQWS